MNQAKQVAGMGGRITENMTYVIGGMYDYVWTIGLNVSLTCFFDKGGKDVHVMCIDPVGYAMVN